ncbi:hypothetical protein ScPMuIL_002838 [Solemya velum]
MYCYQIPLICLLVVLWFQTSHGKYDEDHLVTHTDWEFLSRFCWLSMKGTLDYHFEVPEEYGGTKILLYYDTPGQWFSVYQTEKSCEDKVSVLSVKALQMINITTRESISGCKIEKRAEKNFYVCRGSRYFRSMRERWWYIAVSRCTGHGGTNPMGIDLKFKLWMKNGEDGDILHEEFSADEFYILPIHITFLLIQLVLLSICAVFTVQLVSPQLFHTTYKLYCVSLVTWAVHLLLMSIKYGVYSEDGMEKRGLKIVGHVFSAVSDIFFVAMLLLIASGFTITRGRLTHVESVLLIGFITLYSVLYTCIFIWEQIYFDPGWVLYIYESPPGYCLITLRLIGWVWFFVSVVLTVKRAPAKNTFYILYTVSFSFWFWLVPMMVLISKFAIPQYMREKIVVGIEDGVIFFGHLFFLILTAPNTVNKNFPFHVRTSQIRTEGAPGNERNYFDEHAYQASTSSEQELTRNDVVYDMFVVTCRRVNNNPPVPSAPNPPSYNQAMTMFQTNNNLSGQDTMLKGIEDRSNSNRSGNNTTMTETSMFAAALPTVLDTVPPLEHPNVDSNVKGRHQLPPLQNTGGHYPNSQNMEGTEAPLTDFNKLFVTKYK